jgi:hypothetical protein
MGIHYQNCSNDCEKDLSLNGLMGQNSRFDYYLIENDVNALKLASLVGHSNILLSFQLVPFAITFIIDCWARLLFNGVTNLPSKFLPIFLVPFIWWAPNISVAVIVTAI